MPHKDESQLSIKQLHPTFAADVYGVVFGEDGVGPETFEQIYEAITKVGRHSEQHSQHMSTDACQC